MDQDNRKIIKFVRRTGTAVTAIYLMFCLTVGDVWHYRGMDIGTSQAQSPEAQRIECLAAVKGIKFIDDHNRSVTNAFLIYLILMLLLQLSSQWVLKKREENVVPGENGRKFKFANRTGAAISATYLLWYLTTGIVLNSSGIDDGIARAQTREEQRIECVGALKGAMFIDRHNRYAGNVFLAYVILMLLVQLETRRFLKKEEQHVVRGD